MNPENRVPIEVAAALVFRNGKLLITQRYPEAHLGGLWEFPGGKKEPGETYESCLARELREELGIEVEVQELFQSIIHHYPDKSVHLKFFKCSWREREPELLGCHALAWIGAGELDAYSFPDADAQLLHRLKHSAGIWE